MSPGWNLPRIATRATSPEDNPHQSKTQQSIGRRFRDSIGTDEPIAEAVDVEGTAQIIDIPPEVVERAIGKARVRCIDCAWELTSPVSDEESDEEIRRQYSRGSDEGGDERVGACISNHPASGG